MDQIKRMTIGFLIGLLFTLGSLAIPKTITVTSDFQEVLFGLPFWFVQQDVTAVDRQTPSQMYIQSPWENPTDLRLLGFLGSWILLSAVVICGIEIFIKIKRGAAA